MKIDYTSSYGDIKSFGVYLILQRIVSLVVLCLIVLIMEEEEIVGR